MDACLRQARPAPHPPLPLLWEEVGETRETMKLDKDAKIIAESPFYVQLDRRAKQLQHGAICRKANEPAKRRKRGR